MDRRDLKKGFTIVEMIVVVIVIGILAAITIVSYSAITKDAAQKGVEADAQATGALLSKYKAANGRYPESLTNLNQQPSGDSVFQYAYNSTDNTYCLSASVRGANAYVVSSSTSPKEGTCPGHGTDGELAVTNLTANPSFESGAYDAWARVTNQIVSSWSQYGAHSLMQTPIDTTSPDSYTSVGGDIGGMRNGLIPGKTYTVSATIRLTAAQTGTLDSRARKIMIYYKRGAAGAWQVFQSSAAPNAAGTTRLSVTYTLPSDTAETFIRLYNGAMLGGGNTWWDGVMVTEGSTAHKYADGNTPGWVWSGAPNASSSYGPAVK